MVGSTPIRFRHQNQGFRSPLHHPLPSPTYPCLCNVTILCLMARRYACVLMIPSRISSSLTMLGRVPEACGECFEPPPLPSAEGQAAAPQPLKRVCSPSFHPLGLRLSARLPRHPTIIKPAPCLRPFVAAATWSRARAPSTPRGAPVQAARAPRPHCRRRLVPH